MNNQNGNMYAGDSREIIVSIDAQADVLTGGTIKWALMSGIGDPHLVTKTTGSGISVTAGEFTIRLTPADTSDLLGAYYHEAELTDALGNVSTIMSGTLNIKPSGV